MSADPLQLAIGSVPPGRWAVGVSGGADSVALLRLLHGRGDLSLHVIHLDHQTRGEASTADAEFVRSLADRLGTPCTTDLLERVEASEQRVLPNSSARYRAARLALFRRVVLGQQLEGVLLAHHADDQAETVLTRLLRGSGPAGLGGMRHRARVEDLLVLRPLLGVRRSELREWLTGIDQPWREDASNASDCYLRNRLRRWLTERPELHDALISLSTACQALREWSNAQAPELEARFPADRLSRLPDVLAHESARRWLLEQGSPPDDLSESVLDRLVTMARDAASPAKVHFPGAVLARRRAGWIGAG